jgi:ubiquinone/menaquinone biosynthesis C-methylase UbiE
MKTETTVGRGGDPAYLLGSSEDERRLIEQDAFLGGMTKRLFLEAGIGPGMRVLDVGSGVGDVSLLAASLVGPEGEIVGVDRDPSAVAGARERIAALGIPNVSFVEGDARELDPGTFDAAVGRFVLMYQADPTETIRRVAENVRPGGVFAFQEWTLTDAFLSHPHSPLWRRTSEIGLKTARRAGTQMEMGFRLYRVFVEAGLSAPRTIAERPLGGGPDYPGYRYLAGLMRSMLPLTEEFGVATAEEVGIETLHQRIRDEVVELGGVVAFPSITGAWARKPSDPRGEES